MTNSGEQRKATTSREGEEASGRVARSSLDGSLGGYMSRRASPAEPALEGPRAGALWPPGGPRDATPGPEYPRASEAPPAGPPAAVDLPRTTRAGRLSIATRQAAAEILPVIEALVEGTPAAHPSFQMAREALAVKLVRLRHVSDHLNERHGGSPLTTRGGVLKAAEIELRYLASVEASLAALGLSPGAAAKLGVDVVKGKSLAERLREAPKRK